MSRSHWIRQNMSECVLDGFHLYVVNNIKAKCRTYCLVGLFTLISCMIHCDKPGCNHACSEVNTTNVCKEASGKYGSERRLEILTWDHIHMRQLLNDILH
jgi:hypothetical protein